MSTYICLIYRPPNSAYLDTKLMCDYIRSLDGKNVILLGDFNFNCSNWSSHQALDSQYQIDVTTLLDTIDDTFFYQHVSETTTLAILSTLIQSGYFINMPINT